MHVLVARLGEQKLLHFREGNLLNTLPLSSSRNPPSCAEHSEGTPLGLHAIADKTGTGAEPGTVFVGRKDTGQRYWERADAGPDQKSLVTTRILRLRGLEPGRNQGPGIDSYDRFIYIHGTNRPDAWTSNVSAGCLLLPDAPLQDLFDDVPEGSLVWIER